MANKGPDISYVRGDIAPLGLKFKLPDGTALDVTGFTAFNLTVNADAAPDGKVDPPSGQILQMAGTIRAPATDGIVDFEPVDQTTSDDFVPGVYSYDVSGVDGNSKKVTLLLAGKFTLQQDIGKT